MGDSENEEDIHGNNERVGREVEENERERRERRTKDRIVIKSWDSVVEDILPSHTLSDWSVANLIQSIDRGELDGNLGPYPLDTLKSWQNLSNYLTLSVLASVGLAPHTPIFPGDYDDLMPKQRTEQNLQAIQPYFPNVARVAQYCDIKKIEKELILNLRDRSKVTAFNLDKSDLLEHLIKTHYGSWENLLGEFQLSFLLFMLLYSYPSLNQWKLLVSLICLSEKFLLEHSDFACGFLRCFYEQLHYSPDDFFETEISCENFLRPAFSSLFEILGTHSLDSHVREHRNRIFSFIQKKFNLYDEKAELVLTGDEKYTLVDEDMPVVVSEKELQQHSQTISEGDSYHLTDGMEMSEARADVTNSQVQAGLFNWRYPLLFAEMTRYNSERSVGGEDLVMTAMRILDGDSLIFDTPSKVEQLQSEALKFLENEVSLWSK
jgi:A1 cistron-splicing factor AAR2